MRHPPCPCSPISSNPSKVAPSAANPYNLACFYDLRTDNGLANIQIHSTLDETITTIQYPYGYHLILPIRI